MVLMRVLFKNSKHYSEQLFDAEFLLQKGQTKFNISQYNVTGH